MRSIKNRLLLKGRKNKKTIITALIAIVAMSADAKWLYTVGRRYYYATGFNLLRLSDKLEIDYKYGIFKDVSAIEGNLRAAHQR